MSRQAQRAAAREHGQLERPGAAGPRPAAPEQDVRRSLANATLEHLALALLSGILLAVPFLVPALWWVHYVALVPWVLLVTRERARRAWLYFFAGAYTFFIMALGPLSLFNKAVPFVLGLLYAPFLLPFAVLLRALYRRVPLPLTVLVPVLWVTTEWLRLRYSIGEVAMFPLGSSQFSRTQLIQVADVTGVYGISFLVAGANGAVLDLWRALRAKRTLPAVIPVTCYLLLVIAVLWYGKSRQEGLRLVAGPRFATMQPNAVHYRDPRRALETFEEQVRFTRSAIVPGSADIIAWPENAIGEPISDNARYLAGLAELARHETAHLLIGSFTWAASPSGPTGRVHTSAFYLSPQGRVLGRYDKVHLIPYAEYMPFRGWLNRAGARLATVLLGYTSRGIAGTDVVLFPIHSESRLLHFAVPICFEVSSSGFARQAAGQGADFLVNITSEGLLGPPLYMHMLAHSTLRAVEHRMGVVRVANNGLSGFIDPGGRAHLMRGPAGGWLFREAGVLVDRVPVKATGSGTFYTRHGDLLAYLCVAVTLLLLSLTFVRTRANAASAPGTDKRP